MNNCVNLNCYQKALWLHWCIHNLPVAVGSEVEASWVVTSLVVASVVNVSAVTVL